jgi:hypothetical protein
MCAAQILGCPPKPCRNFIDQLPRGSGDIVSLPGLKPAIVEVMT